MKYRNYALFTSALLLAACASPDTVEPTASPNDYSAGSSGRGCAADSVHISANSKATPDNVSRLVKQSGARSSRILEHNARYSTNYDPDRLNIRLNEDHTIQSVYCG